MEGRRDHCWDWTEMSITNWSIGYQIEIVLSEKMLLADQLSPILHHDLDTLALNSFNMICKDMGTKCNTLRVAFLIHDSICL